MGHLPHHRRKSSARMHWSNRAGYRWNTSLDEPTSQDVLPTVRDNLERRLMLAPSVLPTAMPELSVTPCDAKHGRLPLHARLVTNETEDDPMNAKHACKQAGLWTTPLAEVLRMDAEIGSYQADDGGPEREPAQPWPAFAAARTTSAR